MYLAHAYCTSTIHVGTIQVNVEESKNRPDHAIVVFVMVWHFRVWPYPLHRSSMTFEPTHLNEFKGHQFTHTHTHSHAACMLWAINSLGDFPGGFSLHQKSQLSTSMHEYRIHIHVCACICTYVHTSKTNHCLFSNFSYANITTHVTCIYVGTGTVDCRRFLPRGNTS